MSILSEVDIMHELGKNILIYPFKESSLRGSSINLTASSKAWSLKTKKSIVDKNEVVIPANDTALIETDEIIHVSKKIGGTYHSRVSMATKGCGHIGTTLDPGWIGHSLIAIHNHSDKKIRLAVGEDIVTVVLYYLHRPTALPSTNLSGRKDVLDGYDLQSEDRVWLSENWKFTPELLKEKMCSECIDYKRVKESYRKKTPLGKFRPILIKYALALAILAVILFIGFLFGSAPDGNLFRVFIESYGGYIVAGFIGTILTVLVADIQLFTKEKNKS